MSIPQWPDQERPREKLLARGPEALSDAELLAIFLRTGCAGKTAVDLARELLNRFGCLRTLLETDQETFCAMQGLGPVKYVQLQAVLELGRRYLESEIKKDTVLKNPRTTRNYLRARLRRQPHEVFACLFMDNQNKVIAFEILFHGTIDSSVVHPRTVMERVLYHNAAALIVAHNHPSGVAEPSASDRYLTDRLVAAMKPMDVRILDHVVVGDRDTVSFAERGWII